MKGLLTAILLMAFFLSYGQDTVAVRTSGFTPMTATGYQYKALKVDSTAWFQKNVRFDGNVSFGNDTYAPSAAFGDSSNKVATTKWVKQNSAGGGGDFQQKIDSVRLVGDTVREYYGNGAGTFRPSFILPGSNNNLQQVTDIGSVTTHKITAANLNLTAIQEYPTLADAITAGLINGDIYSLPYNNGNYGLAIVKTGVAPILNSLLLENNNTLQTESGQTLILE